MRFLKLFLASILLMLVATGASFAADRINTLERSGLFGYKPGGTAVRGYDTVAYFTLGKPVEGRDEFTTQWSGALWKFSSQVHLDLFVAEPEKYAPQYGGYCAYGVAVGSLVKIEPELWTILDGKLYLNYNKNFNDKWKQDIAGYVSSADATFERLLEEE